MFKSLILMVLVWPNHLIAQDVRANVRAIQFISLADVYLLEGDKTKAASVYKKVIDLNEADVNLHHIASNKLEGIKKSRREYFSQFEFEPLRPIKKYKSDTFFIKINGLNLPFKVSRTPDIDNDFTIGHGYYFYPSLNSTNYFFDWAKLTHNFSHLTDESHFNSLKLSLKPHIRHPKLNAIFEREVTIKKNRDKVTVDGVELNWHSTGHLISSRLEKSSGNQEINVPNEFSTKYMIAANAVKKLGYSSISVGYERNFFIAPGHDYTISKISYSVPVRSINSNLITEYSAKVDDVEKFPFDQKREDRSAAITVSKRFVIFGRSMTSKVKLVRNKSNIPIYSYDQLSLSLVASF